MKYHRIYDFAVVYYDRKRRRLRMYMTMAENEAQVRADYAECFRERDWVLLAIVRSRSGPVWRRWKKMKRILKEIVEALLLVALTALGCYIGMMLFVGR